MGYLTDTARQRVAAFLLVIGIVVATLAITDTGPLFDDPLTEEERVAQVVERVYAAAAEGDFRTYCALLTPAARERVRVNAARLLDEAGGLGCARILAVAAESFAGISARLREVSVSGPHARVEANVRLADTPGIEARTMLLDRDETGEWRVSDPGL